MALLRPLRVVVALVAGLVAAPVTAAAQGQPPAAGPAPADGWRIAVYPVLAWIPSGIDIDVKLDPGDGDGGFEGDIVDGRFDGAFLGGLSLQKGAWRLDADGVWAAVGGDRPERPQLRVDVDVIYFHVSGGRRIYKDLYATGGVRRLALNYDIEVAGSQNFERKPGVWDPLVGVGWHTFGPRFEFHAAFEAGGFGVGTDVEYAGSFRMDWKPFTHVGLTAGYQWLYFDLEDTVRNRTFRVEQTLQGPIVGLGLYF
jgi:hypothetical protein